jgi:ribonuclease J
MKLTIHRGTHEIGGSCIELKTKSARIVLDIGMPLVDERGEQFNFRPYKKLSGPELIEKKILPNVLGLYGFDKTNKPPDALLISHPHLDHYGLLHYVNPAVPLYMSKGCQKLIELSYYFNETKLDFEKIEIVAAWEAFTLADFTITPYLVDHSGFDAFAFLVEAEGKRIFYSGDFRGHGRKHIVFDKIIEAPPKDIDYLLLEGSHIEEQDGDCDTEEEVELRLIELLNDKDKLYFMAISSQNIDRIVSIYRACKKTGRDFVIDPYTALILEAAKSVSYAIPQHDWREHMKVLFVDNRHTLLMQKDGILEKFKKSEVKYEDILKDKGRYLVKDTFAVRSKFAADKNLSKTTLIYSMWDGYLEDDERLRLFWEENKVPIIHVHTSGHAHVADLKKFADALKPKTIIPIHTFEAEKFPAIFQNVKLLKDGEELAIP